MGKLRVERLRFSPTDDLILLRWTAKENPFEDSAKWRYIHQNFVKAVQKPFTLRAVKEHTQLMLKLFLRNDKTTPKKAETEEQHKEKTQLLLTIADMELRSKNKAETTAVQEEIRPSTSNSNEGFLAEDQDLSAQYVYEEKPIVKEEPETDYEMTSATCSCTLHACDSRKRKIDEPVSIVNDSNFAVESDKGYQLELEERRVTLEERRLLLEERKFELEKLEREKRLEAEIREKEIHTRLISQQQQMLSFFLRQQTNKEANNARKGMDNSL